MYRNITLAVQLDINSFIWVVSNTRDTCGGLHLRNTKSSNDCYGQSDCGENIFDYNRSNIYENKYSSDR
ncbi:MAG: hypothetical protein HWQ35_02320 [Nostoc sp. NMS1]|uniref:hypothetical protein n=1 Tax=unclassified Nostoc TaxID=2593658 RepID=UPI0025F8FB84|nr:MULTISPECIES: hypothetical protein [unclassified Nostoc]MBN3905451.1 hypothetical protein [Nostoc sp. NMS1]MBN3994342.1 hypothetical protein [Nostoc sp. NMS2]